MYRYISMVVQSAPLIKGIKASHIINLKKEEVINIREIYGEYGMDSKVLCQKKENAVLLFYRKGRLEKHLFEQECLDFLRESGYMASDFQGLLEQLSARMKDYVEEGKEFPHETGIFLEYPIADIKAFIAYRGQRFLFCGDWKVYTNLSKAQQKFNEYDEARKEMLAELLFLS